MRLIPALLIGMFAVVCLTGCSHGKQQPAVPKPATKTAKDAVPDMGLQAEFGKARILWNDEKGNRVWDAQFKEAAASQSAKTSALELRGVKATLYKQGKPVSTLTAPRVLADSTTRVVRASGGVKLSTNENGSADCRELVWDAKRGQVIGTGGVTMLRGNVSIAARSFESDTSLKKVRFVQAELQMK